MSETTKAGEKDEGEKDEKDLHEEKIDEAMDGTFPASDPPSHTGTTGPGEGTKE